MITILIAIIIICIYLVCPLIGKIVLLIINSIIPDPIPFVDEILMWIGLCIHIVKFELWLESTKDFIKKHKVLVYSIVIAIIIITIFILIGVVIHKIKLLF